MAILIVNESTLVKATDVHHWEVSIATQAHGFARDWGIQLIPVHYAASRDHATSGDIVVAVLDDADQADALGYHTEDAGISYGRAFVKPTLASNLPVSSVLSHEVLETEGDPNVNRWADQGTSEYPQEACDAVQGDLYTDARGVTLASYVLPAWFDPQGAGPFDLLGNVHAPFHVSPNGYSVVRKNGRATQVFGDRYDRHAPAHQAKAHALSRTSRRLGA